MNPTSQYRSVLIVVYLAAILLAGMALIASKGAVSEQMVKLYDAFATALWVMALGLLTKSLGEKAAAGGGLKGMAASLLTSAKPGDPPAPPAPPAVP